MVTADCVAAARAAVNEAKVPFDLLLSDIELPDGDGLFLMRELSAARRIPGIAVSGFGAEEDRRLSREAGFLEHLTKPVDMSRLEAAIHRVTSGTAQPEEPAELFHTGLEMKGPRARKSRSGFSLTAPHALNPSTVASSTDSHGLRASCLS